MYFHYPPMSATSLHNTKTSVHCIAYISLAGDW